MYGGLLKTIVLYIYFQPPFDSPISHLSFLYKQRKFEIDLPIEPFPKPADLECHIMGGMLSLSLGVVITAFLLSRSYQAAFKESMRRPSP